MTKRWRSLRVGSLGVALALLVGAPAGWAADADAGSAAAAETAPGASLPTAPTPGLRVNTFGTLGLSRHDVPGDQLRSESTADRGIGSRWTGAFDSRIGLQLGAELAPGLEATWQGLLHRQDAGGTGLDTHWAFLGWQPAPQWELRLGRFQSPLYLASDTAQVGLAQPSVRPPAEVQGLIGNVASLDGLWLRRRVPLGEDTLLLDAYLAQHREDRGGFSVNHEPLVGASVSLEHGAWLGHATLAQGRSRIELAPGQPLLAVLAALAEPLLGGDPVAAADYDLRRIDRLRFASAGLRWEGAPWSLQAEVAHVRSASRAFPGATGAYLIAGHSWGAWTPYVQLAWLRGRAPPAENRFSGVSAQAIDAFIRAERESGQTSQALGLRWDLREGWALKAQVDRIRPRTDGRGGLFLNPQLPDGRTSARLYSLTLDWAL